LHDDKKWLNDTSARPNASGTLRALTVEALQRFTRISVRIIARSPFRFARFQLCAARLGKQCAIAQKNFVFATA
jgi:hypothetical protein